MASSASLSVHETNSSYSFFCMQGEKSIIERTMQYIKDRTKEYFDDFFRCRKKKCKLEHVIIWLDLFADFHNKELYLK
jgi:hypothetical protein